MYLSLVRLEKLKSTRKTAKLAFFTPSSVCMYLSFVRLLNPKSLRKTVKLMMKDIMKRRLAENDVKQF